MNGKIKTVILEDDLVSKLLLENYCYNHPNIELKTVFDDIHTVDKYLAENHIDLIFLDVQLKSTNGLDLIDKIPPHTKIIITTGNKENCNKANELGVSVCLMKPITLEAFLYSIESIKNKTKVS